MNLIERLKSAVDKAIESHQQNRDCLLIVKAVTNEPSFVSRFIEEIKAGTAFQCQETESLELYASFCGVASEDKEALSSWERSQFIDIKNAIEEFTQRRLRPSQLSPDFWNISDEIDQAYKNEIGE